MMRGFDESPAQGPPLTEVVLIEEGIAGPEFIVAAVKNL